MKRPEIKNRICLVMSLCWCLAVGAASGQDTENSAGKTESAGQSTLAGKTESAGKKIYAQQCGNCHGDQGQGNPDHFEDPLNGVLSLKELTDYIDETMPEENPDQCTGEDARQVAQFVFDQYYSIDAQRKNNRARFELSRLTVRQYRQSVADLVATFGDPLWIPEERGLSADYFASRGWTEDRRLSKQVDPNIDFGDLVPHFDPNGKYQKVKKKKKSDNEMNVGFSAYWSGGVIPPVTGEYEFIVESKNGFKFFLNDPETPLIDRNVRSDEVVEHREKIFLIADRVYSLSLQMYSALNPPAKIRLLWRPPGREKSIVPETALVPHGTKEIAIVSAPFPADDASFGFERGISISQQWDAATTEGAIQTANWIAERISRLTKIKDASEESIKKVQAFCHRFVARAFSCRLSDEEKHFFVDQHFEKDLAIQDQVKRVVIMTLKSPRFLFPAIQKRDRQHEQVRRMALSLWDSVPDDRLNRLAGKQQLNEEAFQGELYRMVSDPRAKSKLKDFFEYWLELKHKQLAKDKKLYPDFDSQIKVDLETSLELYLDRVVWSEESDFRQLFLADYLFVNQRLAEFYGLEKQYAKAMAERKKQAEDKSDKKKSVANHYGEFVRVAVDPAQRAGVLTHPYLMAELAYHKDSSPIHRGVFVAKRVLGRRLRQPPNDVKPLTEEFNPEMTTRERVEHQTKETTCMSCHRVINPLGFSLENYDAVGRFRTSEKEKTIDVSTVYNAPDGEAVQLNGARDLANYLASDEMAQKSFVRQLFNHFAKQSIDAYGDDELDRIHQRFVQCDFNVRQLLVEIAIVVVNHELPEK
jgi:cytochrome c553